MKNIAALNLSYEDLATVVEVGREASEQKVVRHALETLLESNPTLRLEMAVKLHRRALASLARAAEIAGVDQDEFQRVGEARNAALESNDIETNSTDHSFWSAIAGIGDSGDPTLAERSEEILATWAR